METEKKSKTSKRNNSKVYVSGNFFSAPVEVDEKFVTVRLPAKVAKYLDLNDTKAMFWTPINGVIQLTGNQPQMVIPAMTGGKASFIAQK